LIVRPSGTEPKTKVYAEVSGAPGADQESLSREAKSLAHGFVQEMLRRVGVELPSWSLSLSELLPVEKKVEFVAVTMPRIIEKAASGELTLTALADEVSYLGRDALGLVSDGLITWARNNTGEEASSGLLALLES
jgi:hypothetical protein